MRSRKSTRTIRRRGLGWRINKTVAKILESTSAKSSQPSLLVVVAAIRGCPLQQNNLMGKYIIRNATGTLPGYEDISKHEIYVSGSDERCYCNV